MSIYVTSVMNSVGSSKRHSPRSIKMYKSVKSIGVSKDFKFMFCNGLKMQRQILLQSRNFLMFPSWRLHYIPRVKCLHSAHCVTYVHFLLLKKPPLFFTQDFQFSLTSLLPTSSMKYNVYFECLVLLQLIQSGA